MKVVIGFDGSEAAHRALDRAVDLFEPHRPEFVLVRALTQPMTQSDLAERAFKEALRQAEEEMEGAARAHLAGREGRMRIRILEGEARHVLERVVQKEDPSVVVLGARGHGKVARVLLGSVCRYAVEHFDQPVLVVR